MRNKKVSQIKFTAFAGTTLLMVVVPVAVFFLFLNVLLPQLARSLTASVVSDSYQPTYITPHQYFNSVDDADFLTTNTTPKRIKGKRKSSPKNTETPLQADSISILFDSYCRHVYTQINDTQLNYTAFSTALKGYLNLRGLGKLANSSVLTLVDYSKPSGQNRFFVIDLNTNQILYKTLVAHGRNTGDEYARHFSDNHSSNQSSLGFFVTDQVYTGKQGLSLRLNGQEQGVNGNVFSRGVVVHGADYVSADFISRNGRLGRSNGCPAIPGKLNAQIIEAIKGGSCFFAYYPDKGYLRNSHILRSQIFASQMQYHKQLGENNLQSGSSTDDYL